MSNDKRWKMYNLNADKDIKVVRKQMQIEQIEISTRLLRLEIHVQNKLCKYVLVCHQIQ